MRKSLRPRFKSSLLSSARILAQRSAVPAISSRPTSSSSLKRKHVTREDKERMLRIGKKMRKGPFNAVMDPTELGSGSALLELSEAAKKSGEYDVWAEGDDEAEDEDEDIAPKKAAPKVSLPIPTARVVYLMCVRVSETRRASPSKTHCLSGSVITARRDLI